ncbi:Cell morphogenesis protein PAG1 [Kalmusia sp. IMI 367209]|nr:Cell morphogenesis protein PAG1 [Kalmusia sp. IMI 367209]
MSGPLSTSTSTSTMNPLYPPPSRPAAGNPSHHIEGPSIPSREASLTRGRALTASSRVLSPRSQTPGVVPSSNSSPDRSLERKASLSYAHNRQTSIVHGIQHSRNTSFVNSPATSPLSPHIIAAQGSSLDGTVMSQESIAEAFAAKGTHAPAPFLNGHAPNDGAVSQRKPERAQSARSRKGGHHHHRSQSRHQAQHELKTVGEYALHHLFNSFGLQADLKISQCMTDRSQPEVRVERICGPGVDPNFDQLIWALGHIAKNKPKSLIDTIMIWRKGKSEDASQLRIKLANARQATSLPPSVLPRRNTEPLQPSDSHGTASVTASPEYMVALQQTVAQAEQRSTVSTYILCRVLIQIIQQTNIDALTVDMAERLLSLFYNQLNLVDPEQAEESSVNRANWVIYSQLLGELSEFIFHSVQEKFITDLKAVDTQYIQTSLKSQSSREVEARGALLVLGMRYLRVKTSPLDLWDRTCDFMLSLAMLFSNAHGQTIKYAYCQVLRDLLLRIASETMPQFNTPKWKGVIDILKSRASVLLSKPKHWHEAFPLMCAILCVSPAETFASQWLPLVLSTQPRLKERATRAIALKGICQLVWSYLYRASPDPPNVAMRKLEDIIRMVYQPGRRSYLSTEPSIAEPFIQLTRIIGFKYQDVCFRAIIFPLLNAETFTSGRDLRVENLEPDRMVIGIRSFLAIMSDLENASEIHHPPFPSPFSSEINPTATNPPQPTASPRPPQHPSMKSLLPAKEERLSRPVNFSGFPEIAKEYYVRFCKILGDITIICDNAFGGQAVLDEKFSLQTPKTPMSEAFSFARREDQTSTDPRQGFYDLLHVAVQALPRCLSHHIPFNSLVNLLCTGTAHVQGNIATSSAQSLKSIARQSYAQQVTIAFARFIFTFDDRYSTMSDGGMLGPGHIERTLKLYVELLQIWIEEIKEKTRKAALDTPDDGVGNRGIHLDLSSVWAHVDEIESHGLFFLCSPSRRVRAYAVTVLRLITEFDTALGGSNTRIIGVMKGSPQKVMDIGDEKLSLAERSRLQRGLRKSNALSLVELCSSDDPYDSTLWFKGFPNLVRLSFEVCPFAVTLTRDIICARLSQMHRTLLTITEGPRASPYSTFDTGMGKANNRILTTAPEIIVEQWKLYLIFAFTTLTNLGMNSQSTSGQSAQHSRKSSKSSQKSSNKVHTAGELFSRVLPFLATENSAVRDAAVIGLGSININLYRTLLESLHGHAAACAEEAKTRLGQHNRTISSPRRSRRTDHLRTELTHVYKLTSHFLKLPEAYNDDWILNNLVNYTKDLRIFLSDAEVQNEWGFQKLRTHYCGLIEVLFEGINKTNDPLQWMPFQARKAAFTLMEEWSGYSANQSQTRQREEHMRRSMLDREADMGSKGIATAAMAIEKRDLHTAALSAMAALCGGPVSITTDSKVVLQFDVRRMLSWIDSIFETPSDRTHAIGRRALTNLILHNREHSYLLERAIEMCYISKSSKALESYFEVVTQVLTQREDYTLPFWKVLSAGLYTLGHENNELRMKSARLLRTLETREQKNSKLQDLDISISDKTIAVYKLAQFEVSRRLSHQHSELAFMVFSQFSYYFKELQPDHQRNMVAAMLPWVQSVELQINPDGGPTASSYMLLVNLFEITVRCSSALHNEIQALWQALATGHGGNVQVILNFIINLCLDKREQNFVDYSKQIVVHLSSTPSGAKVVEALLLQINPRSMVHEKREPTPPPPDAVNLPYLADLGALLPTSNKQSGFALGQICLILLVDLMVSPVQLASEHLPLVLQVILVLWDHYTPVVQDQAREMLVHLIHESVISKIEDDSTIGIDKSAIEDFIESVRQHDAKVVWNYDDKNGKDSEDSSNNRVPESMMHVAAEVLGFFSLVNPGLREAWGKVALNWATSCPVRHLACRSFQLFRCILSTLDQPMLSDMLARLSNTISDDESDIQTFSMEILTTLRAIIEALQPDDLLKYPQLFWTTCACLDTIHEGEFMESMLMLDKLLDKVDLGNPEVVAFLIKSRPPKWEGEFEGLFQLVYKGVRSSMCLEQSLRLLERLVVLPSSELVGDESRLTFAVLANMPRFLRAFEDSNKDPTVRNSAEVLAQVAHEHQLDDLASTLTAFGRKISRQSEQFLMQMVDAIVEYYFPQLEFGSLVFLLGLLANKLDWFKINTMQVLTHLIKKIEMRKPEIAHRGPDVISPLLRLLQTDLCGYALQVLDSVIDVTGGPQPPNIERAHIRMSMAGSHTSRAFKKQFGTTQSLYGIPEETGWSIPVPAHHSHLTRSNVHAVFYTCGNLDAEAAADVTTPKIEFRQDEFPFSPISEYRTATMTSEETRGDSHIGELVMKLDSLDDFFEDDDENETLTDLPDSSIFGTSRYANGLYAHSSLDVRENLYDQQTAPILHKSLTRNGSVNSFQSGFSDVKLSPARDPGVMNPAAFGSFTSSQHHIPSASAQPAPHGRPGLHSRSVTSPSAPTQIQRLSPALSSSALDEHGEPFSDDEYSTGRTISASASTDKLSIETVIGGLKQDTRSKIRSGMRRLTGSSGDTRERERMREAVKQALQKSPQVPKVPDIYLIQQNPKSADP